ncbi:DUF4167 domain-containing protein [Mesorhizobium sp. L-8-10]|uniref:DUF4167 domain-containing protein n=1 Tax=Mesorhizobium sp. L-8-10 TaxID=2744523 RepID=UPI00192953C7|nr:DUF4167 domain-containing protein [Mesorhizobium sp. L-8-10]
MRPQQQNRRMRGRNNNNNNNNRKGPNPLTRNYESNGPDVKIRGSAQQIAEKYAALARDAQSSGDRVMAENYLQHAEHYNRIIAAAQAQMPVQQQVRDNRDELDDDLDEERDEFENTAQEARQPEARQQEPRQQEPRQQEGRQHESRQGEGRHARQSETRHEIRASVAPVDGSGPQPVIEGVPAEVAFNQEQPAEPNGNVDQRANGNHVANAEEEAPPRRARRPRRPRVRADNGEAAAGEQPPVEGNAETPARAGQEASDPVAAN